MTFERTQQLHEPPRVPRKAIKDSFFALLGGSKPSATPKESVIQSIRQRMLDHLGDATGEDNEYIARRIRLAEDIEALWYLRGNLMRALAAMHGESQARERMAEITKLFKGQLPGALQSRSSPLGE